MAEGGSGALWTLHASLHSVGPDSLGTIQLDSPNVPCVAGSRGGVFRLFSRSLLSITLRKFLSLPKSEGE